MTARVLKPAPAWLVSSEQPIGPGRVGRRKRAAFLEKTLGDGAEVVRRAMYAESADPVSYTHLDVYKRQGECPRAPLA